MTSLRPSVLALRVFLAVGLLLGVVGCGDTPSDNTVHLDFLTLEEAEAEGKARWWLAPS